MRLIDAEAFERRVMFDSDIEDLQDVIYALRDYEPIADAVQVVRCKDCRHRDPEDHKCDSGENERQGCPFKVADDYFCAYGERRSE